ncbi:uncharacterized protein EI90DRAFT_3021044 [Cantharellus anzutake]|uniref:uncharacterized protein n=1 Tax=Cantharellus anzutake TaxID=1750568 RepID=UPI0019048DFB|nr:uncharacterized protein EI90DRAFT_3021044 [Cantharellus anzutake]KAF8318322.1 hypothetical protein EI90DRAFT_3021044 [Cantharellus anzutake]
MPPASRRKIPSDELRMWARAPKNSVVDPLKTPVTGSGSTVHVLGSILTTGFLLARKGKAPAQGAGLNPGSFRRTRPYWSGVWAEIGGEGQDAPSHLLHLKVLKSRVDRGKGYNGPRRHCHREKVPFIAKSSQQISQMRALATLKSLLGVFADVDEASHTMGRPALKSGCKPCARPGQEWPRETLSEMGGWEAEVVQTSQDRECVASATHITQFRLNDPGWSERRICAE